MATVLVDTNILVYAHDAADTVKQQRAIEVLTALAHRAAGCFSAQNLSEFYWTATRGRHPLLTPKEAAAQVDRLAASWPILDVTPFVVLEATRGVTAHRLSFWDAMVWAVARLNQVPVVLSEDFAHGSRVGGVRFVNPFERGFRVSSLGVVGTDAG